MSQVLTCNSSTRLSKIEQLLTLANCYYIAGTHIFTKELWNTLQYYLWNPGFQIAFVFHTCKNCSHILLFLSSILKVTCNIQSWTPSKVHSIVEQHNCGFIFTYRTSKNDLYIASVAITTLILKILSTVFKFS